MQTHFKEMKLHDRKEQSNEHIFVSLRLKTIQLTLLHDFGMDRFRYGPHNYRKDIASLMILAQHLYKHHTSTWQKSMVFLVRSCALQRPPIIQYLYIYIIVSAYFDWFYLAIFHWPWRGSRSRRPWTFWSLAEKISTTPLLPRLRGSIKQSSAVGGLRWAKKFSKSKVILTYAKQKSQKIDSCYSSTFI